MTSDSDRNKGEQGEHCIAKTAPLFCVPVAVIAKPIVAHDREDEHQDKEEEEKWDDGIEEGAKESTDEHLQSLNERDYLEDSKGTQNCVRERKFLLIYNGSILKHIATGYLCYAHPCYTSCGS